MDLVEEEDRALTNVREAVLCFVEDLAHLFHSDGGSVHFLEVALRVVRDQLRERRLPGARRAVKDDTAEAIRLEHAAEELALAEEVLLADELLERPRAHPHRQGGDALEILSAGFGEEVHGNQSYAAHGLIGAGELLATFAVHAGDMR